MRKKKIGRHTRLGENNLSIIWPGNLLVRTVRALKPRLTCDFLLADR